MNLRPFLPEIQRPETGRLYTYKGNEYVVWGVLEKNLTQFEGEWQPTVRYVSDPQTDLVFYRALTDFNSKFAPVPEKI